MKKIFFVTICLISFPIFAKEPTAKSWLVVEDGHVIQGKNITEIRPIASITKLMTAMVYLDANKYKKINENALQRALVSSDNHAAKQLCEEYPGGEEQCVFMMNEKSKKLGLENTKFVEPTGLSELNISNAEELVKIVEEASNYPEIIIASHTKKRNTNPTINKYDYTVSKTGYTRPAGGCIVVKIKNKIVVLLGSKNTHTRIPEMEALLK